MKVIWSAKFTRPLTWLKIGARHAFVAHITNLLLVFLGKMFAGSLLGVESWGTTSFFLSTKVGFISLLFGMVFETLLA